MINFNTQLSQADAKWIIEDVFPRAGYRINHDTLGWWMRAHNKAFTEQVGIPGCSCEYIATYNVWSSRLSQYDAQIRAIAYPPVVEEKLTRGRKKNNG
jgi:hypothetical protein